MNRDIYVWAAAVIVLFVFTLIASTQLLEAFFLWKGWPTLSWRVANWSRQNSWFAAVLVLALASLLAHFFLHPLPDDQVIQTLTPSP